MDDIISQCSTFVGRYRIVLTPADSRPTVDGALVPRSESPILLDAGEHTLVARAPGHRLEERHIDVKGGGLVDLRLELVADRATGQPPAKVTPAPAANAATPHANEPPLLARRSTWGWVSAGVSALTLAGSVVAWRVGEDAAARWNDDSRCLVNDMTRSDNCSADQQAAKLARTWTTIGLVTAGLLGATATVLLWPGHGVEEQRADERATCGLAFAELGVSCAVGF